MIDGAVEGHRRGNNLHSGLPTLARPHCLNGRGAAAIYAMSDNWYYVKLQECLRNDLQRFLWFARNSAKGWATCPLVEAGFVRILSNPAFSPRAVTPWTGRFVRVVKIF